MNKDGCNSFMLRIHLDRTGELNDAEKNSLHRHLEQCQACRTYRNDLARIHTMMAPRLDSTRSVIDQALFTRLASTRPRIMPFPRLLPLAAAAILLVTAMGAATLISIRLNMPGPSPAASMENLVAILTEQDSVEPTLLDPESPEDSETQTLAYRLLLMQGFDPEDFTTDSAQAEKPTNPLGHNSRAPQAETRV